MSSEPLDISSLTGLQAGSPEEFKAILRRLSYFGAKGSQDYINDLLEHVVIHTLSRMPGGSHPGTEIYQKLRSTVLNAPFELEPILAALRRLENKNEVHLLDTGEGGFDADAEFWLDPKTVTLLRRNYREQEDFEQRVLNEWITEVQERHPELKSTDLDYLLEDLAAFSYRLYSQHSVESVMLYFGEEENLHKLLEKMDEATLGDILPRRPEALHRIRIAELPRFFKNATTDRKLYIGQQLNSVFMLHMLQLDPASARQAKNVIPGGTLFLDTNYLYRLFGLDGDDLQDAALRLQELSKELNFRMVVSPRTIEEYNLSIQASLQKAKSFPSVSQELAEAALASSSGVDIFHHYFRLLKESKGKMDFEGYLRMFTNIDMLLKHYGIEVEPTYDTFVRTQFEEVAREESLLRQFVPEKNLKQNQVVNHDAHMRLLILQFRQGNEEASPLETRYWLLTLDTRLVQYDERVRPRDGLRVPYCVLSSHWMQLLRPFGAALQNSQRAYQIAQASSLDSPLFRLFRLPEPATVMDIITRMKMIEGMPPELITHVVADGVFVQAFSDTRDETKRQEMIQQRAHDEMVDSLKQEREKLEKELEEVRSEHNHLNRELGTTRQSLEENKRKQQDLEDIRRSLTQEVQQMKVGQEGLQEKLQSVEGSLKTIAVERQQLINRIQLLDEQKTKQQSDLDQREIMVQDANNRYMQTIQQYHATVQNYQTSLDSIRAGQARQTKTLAILFTAIVIVLAELASIPWQLDGSLRWIRLSFLIFGVMIIEGIVYYRQKFRLLTWAIIITANSFALIVGALMPFGAGLPEIINIVAGGVQALGAIFAILIYYRDRKRPPTTVPGTSAIPGDLPLPGPEVITSASQASVQVIQTPVKQNPELNFQWWESKGDRAMVENDWDSAISAYRQAGASSKFAEATSRKQHEETKALIEKTRWAHKNHQWKEAARGFQQLSELEADQPEWKQALKEVEEEILLEKKYEDAVNNLRWKNGKKAEHILTEILNLRPNYRDARALKERAQKYTRKQPADKKSFSLRKKNIITVGVGIASITLLVLVMVLSPTQSLLPQPTQTQYVINPLNSTQIAWVAATKTALANLPTERFNFNEDFSANTRNWNTGPIDWADIGSQDVRLEDGILRVSVDTIQPILGRADLPGVVLKDFVISMDARIIQYTGPTAISFLFRVQDLRYYQVRYEMSGACLITYHDEAGFHELRYLTADENGIRLSPGVTNHFSVRVKGEEFTVYANGQEVATVKDATLAEEGGIAIGTDAMGNNLKAIAEFDNLAITTIQ